MQQLQNNCTPQPCWQGTDDDVIGEVESTDGNAFIRGRNRIQERQKYSTPDLDSEANCRESKTKGVTYFHLLLRLPKGI